MRTFLLIVSCFIFITTAMFTQANTNKRTFISHFSRENYNSLKSWNGFFSFSSIRRWISRSRNGNWILLFAHFVNSLQNKIEEFFMLPSLSFAPFENGGMEPGEGSSNKVSKYEYVFLTIKLSKMSILTQQWPTLNLFFSILVQNWRKCLHNFRRSIVAHIGTLLSQICCNIFICLFASPKKNK